MSSGQLKIAMLSVHSCPLGSPGAKDTGGMNVYIRELASELGKRGHLVDVYSRAHDPDDGQIIGLGQNARLIHLPAGENEEMHKLVLYCHLPDFACNVESFRKDNGLQYDLVFSHYWLSGCVGEYLQLWWDVPHIVTFHTLGAAKNAVGVGEDEPELRIETERYLARSYHTTATTEKEKRQLVQYYGSSPERISVVPCGVNLKLFQPIDKEIARKQLGFGEDKIVLFVGRIEPLKGVAQLLRAMQYLQNGHQARLVVVGGDEHSQDEVKRLQKLSRDLSMESPVTFLGVVKHEELPKFYSAADVCVIPSYYESFGLVVLESLACGTPVVAADVADFKSIIRQGETGYVVAENTPLRLAEKISLILSKPNADIKSIRESVTRFSWSNIAQTIIKQFGQILTNYPDCR